jgi:lauroyl/myristoyl acyltransferase
MASNFYQFATSGFGTRLWLTLGGLAPPRLGRLIARAISGTLASRVNSPLYRSIYANQAVILGGQSPASQVHAAAGAVLRHAGQVAFDLVHTLAKGERAIFARVDFAPELWADLAAARADGRGIMVCGAHLSNFNLAFLALALRGVELQMLSPAVPNRGFALVRELRSRGRLIDTPINLDSLRAAMRRLQSGGIALTGVDWPNAPGERAPLRFFDRPALMPTGHVRLALSTGAALLPVAAGWDAARQCYFVRSAPPIQTQRQRRDPDAVSHYAQRVLEVIEHWIREKPDQWLMYHPVWSPDVEASSDGVVAPQAQP